MVGRSFGSYEIKSLLGTGGMGEVYLARDSRLNRDVAIKVLPPDFSRDAGRVSRFRREAQVLASLNHPHVAAIYDTIELGESRVLVLELVPGETLASRISDGAIPLDEALRIAKQIADALEAVHEKGIVHRDLKPANIKITPNGSVKVLDFGLAKIGTAESDPPETVTKLTVADGTVMGTVAYMSPEQAKGKEVDRTTDVWAFGCVLYEMLTGHAAFEGRTQGEILAAVFNASPDWRRLPEETPEGIHRLLRRCFQEEARYRLRDMGDARIEIEEVQSSRRMTAPPGAVDSTPTPSRRSWRIPIVTTALVLAIAGGMYWNAKRGMKLSSSSAFSLQNADILQLTTTGNAQLPAISADGRYVVYVQRDLDQESLWLRQTATTSNVQIVPPRPNVRIVGATITPDGNFVDFVAAQQTDRVRFTLWRVPFLGRAAPQKLLDNVDSPVTWSPDGKQMAFVRGDSALSKTELIVADPDGRNEHVLVTRQDPEPRFFTFAVPSGNGADRPAWSPDGKLIAVVAVGFESGALKAYMLFVNVADGSVRSVPKTGNGEWIDESSLLVSGPQTPGGASQLWRLSLAGDMSRLTNDLMDYSNITFTHERDKLALVRTQNVAALWIGDGEGKNGRDVVPRVAPPGIAGSSLSWSNHDLFYQGLAGTAETVAMFSPDEGTQKDVINDGVMPAVTSDGSTIAYLSWGPPETFAQLWKADGDGRHAASLNNSARWMGGVTGDDRAVILANTGGIWMVPFDGSKPTNIANVAVARTPDLSPDRKRVAFVSLDNDNRPIILICPLSDCTSPARLKPAGLTAAGPEGGGIRWTPDGRGIAFIRTVPEPNIWIQPLDGSPPRQLTRFSDGMAIPDFAWSRDGQRMAAVRFRAIKDIVLFSGLRNVESHRRGN